MHTQQEVYQNLSGECTPAFWGLVQRAAAAHSCVWCTRTLAQAAV